MDFDLNCLLADLNHNKKVDLPDLTILANAYGSQPGDANWNPRADIAEPWNIVGLSDLVTLGRDYGFELI